MNNAPCTKATHTASNTVSRSPTAWAFWDARKSQVSNSTYALKQNKPKTNAKRISNCQCSCCSLLSLYHLLPGTNTSTFVQSCCRKDQETDSVWIWSLCTCTNTFDSKGAGEEEETQAEAERCPVEPWHCHAPRSHWIPPAARQGPTHWKYGREPQLCYLSEKLHLIVQILAFTTRRWRTRMCPRQLVAINNY